MGCPLPPPHPSPPVSSPPLVFLHPLLGSPFEARSDSPTLPCIVVVLGAGGKSIAGTAMLIAYEKKRVTGVLMQSKTFEGIRIEDADRLVTMCDLRSFEPGDLLIRQVGARRGRGGGGGLCGWGMCFHVAASVPMWTCACGLACGFGDMGATVFGVACVKPLFLVPRVVP